MLGIFLLKMRSPTSLFVKVIRFVMQNIDWNSFSNSTILIEYLPFVKQVEEIKRPINHKVKFNISKDIKISSVEEYQKKLGSSISEFQPKFHHLIAK